MPKQLTLTTLRDFITEHLSLQDVRTLCVDCDVDYEKFGEQGKEALARELVRERQKMMVWGLQFDGHGALMKQCPEDNFYYRERR